MWGGRGGGGGEYLHGGIQLNVMKYPEHRECVGETWEPATISKESLVDQGAAGTSPYHTVSMSVDYVDYGLASGFLFPCAPGYLKWFAFLNQRSILLEDP